MWGDILDVLVSNYQRLSDNVQAVYGAALDPAVATLSHAMSNPAFSFNE